MRQGITTRYIGPTNTKGSRYKAVARKGTASYVKGDKELSVTVHPDHALNYDDNHAIAAKALAVKLGWSGLWVGGGSPDERGYQFVALEGTFSRAWVDKYIAGKEGRDWFFIERTIPEA